MWSSLELSAPVQCVTSVTPSYIALKVMSLSAYTLYGEKKLAYSQTQRTTATEPAGPSQDSQPKIPRILKTQNILWIQSSSWTTLV
jgi:hypothetical protein